MSALPPEASDPTARLAALATALRDVPQCEGGLSRPLDQSTVFLGSGDSLSSALLAEHLGFRARSSGDVTWSGTVPPRCNTVVGISHSGSSAATVQALRLARQHGARAVAITSDPTSPLAQEADELQVVPALDLIETVPVGGHLMLGLGVARVCGVEVEDACDVLARTVSGLDDVLTRFVGALPVEVPEGISVLTLPELRGAGDFWMLKLIEATGITTRSAPLEESGHVDYFIGPQNHLAIQLVGRDGAARHARLGEALASTGQTVRRMDLPVAEGAGAALLTELTGAVAGSVAAEGVAARWMRPLFRGGAVNMDASHIKIDLPAPTPV